MLSSLNPPILWRIFLDICAIPHPSLHEEKIIKYVIDLAQKNNIHAEQDKIGNILLRKEPSSGMEHYPSIALQAHLDMVPQKNEETKHDFLRDPIRPYIDNEWLKAKGTTLGADNGIGLASILALLIDRSIKHGPLEALLTVSEEVGMQGASGLRPDWLKSKYLINTDSENEGEIFIGCAGGIDFTQSMPITRSAKPKQHDMVRKIFIKGLLGGHSGCDINKGRSNAIKLLVRFMVQFMDDFDFRIANIEGGDLKNAICRQASLVITFNSANYKQLTTLMDDYYQIIKNETFYTEPNLIMGDSVINGEEITNVISYKHHKIIINWLNSMPHGVVSMCYAPSNVVESSVNLGVLKVDDHSVVAQFLIRSLIESAKDNIVSTLTSLSKLIGLNYQIGHNYPSWPSNKNSLLLNLVKNKYEELFLKKAKVMVVHAGLECALLKRLYSDIDIVSIGPTIVSPHSPDEKVNIETVCRYWQLLLQVLKSAGELT